MSASSPAPARAATSFVDRDFNAALNILAAFNAADVGAPPPPHMRRAAADDVRERAPPARFFLAPRAEDPAGAHGDGWRTHERRARAARRAAADAATYNGASSGAGDSMSAGTTEGAADARQHAAAINVHTTDGGARV
jgi:hypothetical protein